MNSATIQQLANRQTVQTVKNIARTRLRNPVVCLQEVGNDELAKLFRTVEI